MSKRLAVPGLPEVRGMLTEVDGYLEDARREVKDFDDLIDRLNSIISDLENAQRAIRAGMSDAEDTLSDAQAILENLQESK